MKWQALVILAAIVGSIIVPSSLPLFPNHDGQAAVETLDVCHSATPAISSNGDMPCVNECPCQAPLLALSSVTEILSPPFKPFFIAFQDERPPKI
jgi:hypothetical protein